MVNLEATTPAFSGAASSYTLTVADTLAFGDSPQRLSSSTRSLADALAIGDFNQIFKLGVHDIVDALSLADSLSHSGVYSRSPADTLVLGDLQTRTLGFTRYATDLLVMPSSGITTVPSAGSIFQIAPNASVTATPSSRCIWVMKNILWAFWLKGSSIYYATSGDGITWGAPVQLVSGAGGFYDEQFFASWYDHVTKVLWIVWGDSVVNGQFDYQAWTPNKDGTLSVVVPQTNVATVNTNVKAAPTSIFSDASNNIWVSVITKDAASTSHTEVWRFDGASWANKDDISGVGGLGAVLKCTSGMVHVYCSVAGGTVNIKRTTDNGSTWSGPVSSVNSYLFAAPGVVVSGDLVHVAAVNTTGPHVGYFNYTFGNAAVANEVTLGALQPQAVSLSLGPGSTLYIFYNDKTSLGINGTAPFYYAYSLNAGTSWTIDVNIDPTGYTINQGNGTALGISSSYEMRYGTVATVWDGSFFKASVLNQGDLALVTAYLNLSSPVDTLVFGDFTSAMLGHLSTRTVMDALVLDDFSQNIQGWSRSFADTLVFQDLTSRILTATRSNADTLVLRDFRSQVQGWARSLADTLVLSDLLARTGSYTRNPGDTMVLQDLASRVQGWIRTPVDILILSDLTQIVAGQAFSRTIMDTLVFGDAFTRVQGWTRSNMDTLVFSDFTQRLQSWLRSTTDTLVFRDFTSQIQGWVRSPIDALVLKDFVQQSQGWSRLLADTLVLNDSLLRSQGWVRSLADVLVFTDLVTATLITGMTRLIFDTLTIGDAATRTISFIRTSVETIQLSDTVSFTKVVVKIPGNKITKYFVLRKRMARHEPQPYAEQPTE